MSDRICGFVVILEKDLREEGADQLMQSIRLLKGVVDVRPQIADLETNIGYSRGKLAIKEKLMEFLRADYLADHPEMEKYMK